MTPARFGCSPSTFHDAEACPLKFVGDETPPMPTLPWHVHGTLVHGLIASPPPDGDFEAAYDDRLARLVGEARSGGNRDPWLVAFVKLDEAGRCSLDLPGFAVRRASGIALARRLAREASRGGSSMSGGPANHEVKVTVESMNATIDALSEEEGRIIVTDFKTGAIREPGIGQTAIKPRYRTQLLIYSAMVRATSGRWPDRIRLIGPDGDVHEEEVDQSEAEALLARCMQLRDEVRELLAEGRDDALARGFGTVACTSCSRRHRCPRSTEALRSQGYVPHDSGKSGFFDLQGRVIAAERGRTRPWLDVALAGGRGVNVRVLNIAQAKPTGLHGTIPGGTAVRVFGVRARAGGPQSFLEPPPSLEASSTTYVEPMDGHHA